MPAKIDFQFDLGLLGKLARGDRAFRDFLHQAMSIIAIDAVERSRANAPILPPSDPRSGDLRRSLKAEVQITKDGVQMQISSDVPYALRMHEELTPAGPLNLGPFSAVQPRTPEGGVGGKYVERVLFARANDWRQHLAEQLSQHFDRIITGEKVVIRRIGL